VSNRRKVKQVNGGKLTRDRADWTGKIRLSNGTRVKPQARSAREANRSWLAGASARSKTSGVQAIKSGVAIQPGLPDDVPAQQGTSAVHLLCTFGRPAADLPWTPRRHRRGHRGPRRSRRNGTLRASCSPPLSPRSRASLVAPLGSLSAVAAEDQRQQVALFLGQRGQAIYYLPGVLG